MSDNLQQATLANEPDRGWTLVVAISQNNVIGHQGDLPWRLSSDLRRFKQLTMGHALLMGRKTFESIGKALPGRQTIVLSRSGFEVPDPSIRVVSDVSEVDGVLEDGRQVMVVGGAQIYEAALPWCSRLWITRVQAEVAGDVFFPDLDWDRWKLESTESIPTGPKDEWPTEFQRWVHQAPSASVADSEKE